MENVENQAVAGSSASNASETNLLRGGMRHGLYFQATLLLLFVLFVAALEVSIAVYYKNILKTDFLVISKFDDKERDLLRGIMVSSEMQYELSIPVHRMVFLRVSLWVKRLEELSALEAIYTPDQNTMSKALERLQVVLSKDANDDQLIDVIVSTKHEVNNFNASIREILSDMRLQRAASVERYSEKSDYYATILLIIGATGLIIILIVTGRFLIRLMFSIKILEQRAREISVGNYGQPIHTKRKDEIGDLIDSVNVMATSLDQREREIGESRRRLFQQEKVYTVGSFAAGLAHEIGNPIQALLALNGKAIETLIDDPKEKDIDDTIETLSLASEQIERLSNSIRDMREFTYTGETEKRQISLNEVIENSIKLMRFDKRFKTLCVKTELSAAISPVLADSDQITQSMINLLVNAADAVDEDKGEIIISTYKDADFVALSITDNGMGMTSEQLDHILEPFFTTKAKGEGTGLGLSVCKQIVDEHNGELVVNSTLGEGTTVTIRLPSSEISGDAEGVRI